MFNIGDKVLYGGEGVCRVDRIEDKCIAGKKVSYYVLDRLDGVNSIFFVPVDSRAADEKMRKVISAEEIKKIIVEAEPSAWPETERERKELYRNAIATADRESIASLIKTVCSVKEELEKNGKKLHKTEEYFLDDAKKLMYGELAAVFNIEKSEIIPFILGKVNPTEK